MASILCTRWRLLARRWVLVQFGAFIVLCGATHLINMWTFREHTRTVAMVMTVAKLLTALVSCATALMLVRTPSRASCVLHVSSLLHAHGVPLVSTVCKPHRQTVQYRHTSMQYSVDT